MITEGEDNIIITTPDFTPTTYRGPKTLFDTSLSNLKTFVILEEKGNVKINTSYPSTTFYLGFVYNF